MDAGPVRPGTAKHDARIGQYGVASSADPDERARLWARFLALESSAFTDASAALRCHETSLVILTPKA